MESEQWRRGGQLLRAYRRCTGNRPGSNDDGTIGELFAVLGVGREEALKQSSSRIKNGSTLTAGLHSDMNLLEVHELSGDLGGVGVTAANGSRARSSRSTDSCRGSRNRASLSDVETPR